MGNDGLGPLAPGSHGWRRHRCEFLALEPNLDHVWAALVVVVEFLAMHAVDALIDVDVPLGMDRLHGALLGTAVAGRSAFLPATQPFEGSDATGNR